MQSRGWIWVGLYLEVNVQYISFLQCHMTHSWITSIVWIGMKSLLVKWSQNISTSLNTKPKVKSSRKHPVTELKAEAIFAQAVHTSDCVDVLSEICVRNICVTSPVWIIWIRIFLFMRSGTHDCSHNPSFTFSPQWFLNYFQENELLYILLDIHEKSFQVSLPAEQNQDLQGQETQGPFFVRWDIIVNLIEEAFECGNVVEKESIFRK